MNHSETVEQMVIERYLLDELAPDMREAFEEHMFGCPECALDLRAGAAFVNEAKVQLPGIAANAEVPAKARRSSSRPSLWLSWWRPAFVAPAFAAMLLVLVFQNVVTFPALREAANQPRIVPVAPLHGATRGGNHLTLTADRTHGVALPVDLSVEAGMTPAVSYSFDLRDPQGKVAWTGAAPATAQESTGDQPLSIVIPGGMLRNGTYSLSVTSVAANGERTPIQQYIFDIVVSN
jgi:anti-sigma factor RsiW